MKPFDVKNIILQDKNLIEASAGTGKTFSIGILTLRLILEKEILIEEILMVTFTNSAVAELEIRTRNFLKSALFSISANSEVDSTIKFIIERAVKNLGKEKVKELLSNAILFLDETSIYTIHGFCQLTLSEFAFETKQLFNAELVENQTSIIEKAVNEFWRNEITTLDLSIIELLKEKKFSREMLVDFANNIFNGKKLSIGNTIDRNNILSEIKRYKSEIEINEKQLEDVINENWETIIHVKIHKGTNIFRSIAKGQQFFKEAVLISYNKDKLPKAFENLPFLISPIDSILDAKNTFNNYKLDVFIDFLSRSENFLRTEVEQKKNRNQVLSFSDLINKLHTSLVVDTNEILKQKLCGKYKAVFIDEFQDTDHLQYEIFHKAFVEECDSIVFFIGDPKQSIYAWRGADLKTYVKAQKDVGDNKFTMTSNFRSTPKLISAMNDFFKSGQSCISDISTNSDPFCSEEIKYENVDSGNTSLGVLANKIGESTSFDIINHPEEEKKKDYLFEAAGREIIDLLSNHYLEKDGIKIIVKPKNICVLVRGNSETKIMKNILSQYSIPAIIIDDTKIMDTGEARDLFYILYAIEKLDSRSISRALLNSFTNYGISDIERIDLDYHKQIFLELQDIWEKSGVYSVILNFISKYNVRELLLSGNNPRGNRTYSNLMQLAEILNEKEFNNSFSSENLLDWFQKSREGLESMNSYEQRIESDGDAVEIMTIHKSKGLSFDIVILPDINLKTQNSNKHDSITYLNDDGFYVSYHKTDDELEMYNFQSEQENRRLLYVAITRAVYKCIIHYNDAKGTLQSFIPNLNYSSDTISFREPLNAEEFTYTAEKNKVDRSKVLMFNKYLDDMWRLTSYSALDTHSRTSVKKEESIKELNEYDNFIYKTLTKGAQTGNILHNTFEKIDFGNDKFWKKEIEKNLKIYGRNTSEAIIEKYIELLKNTIKSKLYPNDFSLSEINHNKRFNELEFYFSFDKWNPFDIKEIIPNIHISEKQIKGIMHGFIDLLFEHQGMFYILDWKSNHLGNNLENYAVENLQEAMTENNYHLQYIVYSIAVKRFLENRIVGFDYDTQFGGVYYLFLRGMREHEKTGIYFNKPTLELVNKLDALLK